MNYIISVQKKAFEDIENIGDYIATTLCAPDASLKLLAKFNNAIIRIRDFPFSGEILKTDYPFENEYRRIIVDNYIIFYTVDEENSIVNIMRVLFGSSNYSEILKNQ